MFKRRSLHRAASLYYSYLHRLHWLLEFSMLLLFAACGNATPQTQPTEALLVVFTATPAIPHVVTATPTGTPIIVAATPIPRPSSEPTNVPPLTLTPEPILTISGSSEDFSESS